MPLMTIKEITDALRLQRPDVTEAKVRSALQGVDQDAIYANHRGTWTVEIWDRTSPINGVDASHFNARPDVPADGQVYLLKKDGQVVVFQPHMPDVGGLQPITNGQATGGAHADGIARGHALDELLATVLARLPA